MAVSFLLDIDTIPGESSDDNGAYNKKIEIDGWGFGAHQTGVIQSGTGRASGKVQVHDFSFTKHADISSPKLLEICATGQHQTKATLICRRTGLTGGTLEPYLNVVFSDFIVSSYQTSGTNGDTGLPVEHISLNFAQIQYQYIPQDKGVNTGNLMAGYDLKTSTSS